MDRIALKMLLGDRAKYLGLVFGVTFATLLMAQQVSIFIGVMTRSASAIYNVSEADVWVMDPRVRYIDEVEPMRDIELSNVRSVPGVAWAVPYYKGLATVRIPGGLTQQVELVGVDDSSLVGMCTKMVDGKLSSIRRPQSAIIDLTGFRYTWPDKKPKAGAILEINESRLKIDGVCDIIPTFLSLPVLYVSYGTAMEVISPARNNLSFVLAKPVEGLSPEMLAARISQQTGLQALTQHDFAWRSIDFMMERTGIPINFAITIGLGVIVGAAITAQTFYIFVLEHTKQFAAMKAIGVTNRQLMRMVVLQASLVAAIGFSLGIAITAFFFDATSHLPALKGFELHWQVIFGTAAVIVSIVFSSIVYSLKRVFTLDPAIVFRG